MAQVGGHRPQVADEVGGSSSGHARLKAATQLVVLHAATGAAGCPAGPRPRRACRPGSRAAPPRPGRGPRCAACPAPAASNASAQSSALSADVGPGGRDRHPLGGRLLVEPDGRLDRPPPGRADDFRRGDVRVGLDRRRGSLGDEVAQRAGLHALLAEAGQDVGDVGQVGLVRADEQHAAAAVTEARVGVEQVGRAVQRDDGLAGARAAVDDERAAGSGADDGVLVGLDGAEHVAHPGRAVAAQAGDERGLVVERGACPSSPSAVNTSSQ